MACRLQRYRRIHKLLVWIILLTILCLLRKEPEVVVLRHHSTDHVDWKLGKRIQTIVILPGPHKTGTTSVQTSLYNWISEETTLDKSLFQNWSFPIPTPQELQSMGSDQKVVNAKGYSPMITKLFGVSKVVMDSPVIRLYRAKLQAAWEEGKSIVLASEHLDRLAKEGTEANRLSPDQLWERLLECLPDHPDIQRRIVVGIQHRTPRIDHLMSLWRHAGQRQESLADYIAKAKSPGLRPMQHMLNSLGLADYFVQRGHLVVVVDTGGAAQADVELPVAMACKVLQVPCTTYQNGTVVLGQGSSTNIWLHQRTDSAPLGLDSSSLAAIARMFQEYDCQFEDFVRRSNVRLAFADNLFTACPASLKRRTFSETIQNMVDLVCQETNCKTK